MNPAKYLSRGTDHVQNIGSKLRDLQGYGSLLSELVQNADDVPDASLIRFDVRQDALHVENDGVFSDCGEDDDDCPWREEKNRLCDFHRFRKFASGDKRNEAGTTGAFGIGFVAVYQITDRPELISNGRHWIIREDEPEDERIAVCAGCPRCEASDLSPTRFILPWAFDETPFRKALRAGTVSKDGRSELLEDLERRLDTALLFLKRIRRIEVMEKGKLRRCLDHRVDEDGNVIVGDGGEDRRWFLVDGDFAKEAQELRDKYPSLIEAKRDARVKIAIPDTGKVTGLLYAALPTQHETGLPFHLHADFFPTSDRKGIVFESDFQSEWNRKAVASAGQALAGVLDRLPEMIGHERLWEMLERLERVADEAEKGLRDRAFAELWKAVAPELRTTRVVYTTRGDWRTPADTVLLHRKEEEKFVSALDAIGLEIVHADLRRHLKLLRAEPVGVPEFNVSRLCEAMVGAGLDRRVEESDWPGSLREEGALDMLWKELACLTERERRRSDEAVKRDEDALKEVAAALATDGALWPCGEVRRGDEKTVSLFQGIDPAIPFMAASAMDVSALKPLCPEFDVTTAVEVLERVGRKALMQAQSEGRFDLERLFSWLEDRRRLILGSPCTKDELTKLSIFPSSNGLQPLSDVALPGDFDDPLGLAAIVDLAAIGERCDFLRELGMQELGFTDFVKRHLPKAFEELDVPDGKRREAVELLADRLRDIKDDEEILEALGSCRLVECEDGEFRDPDSVYFGNECNREILGETVAFAAHSRERERVHRDLYGWLGVANRPRAEDLIARVEQLTTEDPPTKSPRQAIAAIFEYLGKRGKADDKMSELEKLRRLPWLPAQNCAERWHKSCRLYAASKAHLFKTQAQFLDIEESVQDKSSSLMEFLEIKTDPDTVQVVRHLVECVKAGSEVDPRVYDYLNFHAEDPALKMLQDEECLWLCGRYVRAKNAFWGQHGFGRFRVRLGKGLGQYDRLFSRLGVREEPDWGDAKSVLHEISEEFAPTGRSLDEDTTIVLNRCWEILEDALASDDMTDRDFDELREIACVPNREGVLHRPDRIFIENRTGLAAKFEGSIDDRVITRPSAGSGAMKSAGVRTLGEVMDIELIEATDPVKDEDIGKLVLQRREQIARVLPPASGTTVRDSLARLDNVIYESVSDLEIRYALKAFDETHRSAPERVGAVYLPEDRRLCFLRCKIPFPWPALARELSVALQPDEEPGHLAAGLKEALAADTNAEADDMLDQLGVAPVSLSEDRSSPPDTVADKLAGGEGDRQEGDAKVEHGQGAPEDTEPGGRALDSDGSADRSPEGASETMQPSPPPASAGTGHVADGKGKPHDKVSSQRPVSRLRTYVIYGKKVAESEEVIDAESAAERSEIESAGVSKVIEGEKDAGRIPKKMPPMHPGYDIESWNGSGEIERYIEVKSRSGEWDGLGVALSRTQFDQARAKGKRYWLYVVEHATGDKARIHRIQDPAQRVEQFFYDDGWRDASTQEGGEAEEDNGFPDFDGSFA